MKFTIKSLATCAGGGHIIATLTVNGRDLTRTYDRRTLLTALDELSGEELVLARVRSYLLDNNLASATPLQIRNALVGQEFEV